MTANDWSEERLPQTIHHLLRVLAEPTTPHTTLEIWCRIVSIGWDRCLPILIHELESDDPDVVRLVLNVFREQFEQFGADTALDLPTNAVSLLDHEDRLVRQAAIGLIQAARKTDEKTVEGLKRIVIGDEPILRREAAHVLIELNDGLLHDLPRLFKGPSG